MPAKYLTAGALLLALTVAGFLTARAITARDARRDSQARVEIAAAQIQSRLEEAIPLTNSLQRFMLDAASVDTAVRPHVPVQPPHRLPKFDFKKTVVRWLLPAGFSAAGWAEQVTATDRAGYERRLGRPIVTLGAPRGPAPRASSYLPATVLSGTWPLNLQGVDLAPVPGLAAALRRATRARGVNVASATPFATERNVSGVFVVAPAPDRVHGALHPGLVTLFVPATTLRAAASNTPGLRLGDPSDWGDSSNTVHEDFAAGGQRYSVILPKEPVRGSSALLPWVILGGGLVLVAATGALGAIAARRAKAQADLDRSKSELAASRRRIVAASDEARRQIERDLHDGTQQRLVSLALAIRAAEVDMPPDQSQLRSELSQIATGLRGAVEDLRELSHGLHPAILGARGLRPALEALARRSAIPVEVEITTEGRLSEPIEVGVYYIASEALANAAKHSQASCVNVSLSQRNANLLLEIRDDGVGGADPTRGSGLVGLTDRVDALGGWIRVESVPAHGTRITAELPAEVEKPTSTSATDGLAPAAVESASATPSASSNTMAS